VTDAVKDAARTAESSTAFRVLARSGFAANGLVHLLIGVIVIVVAFGADADADQAGAFTTIARAPLGFAALWILATGLMALGLWHAAEAILARAPGDDVKADARKWGIRASEWGQALVFAVLGVLSAAVALGARPNGEEAAEGASRGVLTVFGGPVILGLVGLGIGIGGISFIVMGFLRSFHKKVDIPRGPLGTSVTALGVVGFVAKGIALVIVGILLVVAAVTVDPETAGGIDGAVQALLALAYGPWLAGAVGIGFIAYGVFCLFRARYARM
jgi:hypothetical protein